MKNVLLLLALTLGSIGSAMAEQGNLQVKSQVFKVVETTDENGQTKTELINPDDTEVLPEDTVYYINTVKNVGKEAADSVVLTNPVAGELTYVAGSAAGAGSVITYSIDGGRSFDLPENLKVKGDDGLERLATAKDYQVIRWEFQPKLQPGEETMMSFRAVLGREE